MDIYSLSSLLDYFVHHLLHQFIRYQLTHDMSEVVKLPVSNRIVLGSTPGSVKQ